MSLERGSEGTWRVSKVGFVCPSTCVFLNIYIVRLNLDDQE